jgi:hypothetical protein
VLTLSTNLTPLHEHLKTSKFQSEPLTFHVFLVVVSLLLQVTNLDAAANLGEDGGAKQGNGNWDLLVAWESSGDNNIETLELRIEDGTAIALKLWSTANKWQARSTWLAAHFTVQAAAANLSGTTTAIHILQIGENREDSNENPFRNHLLQRKLGRS